jgi:hypothetical protein
MSRTVTLVFEPDYGDELQALALRTAVWIVETETNRIASEEVWRRSVEWPHISVTIFRRGEGDIGWPGLLDQIELHHGPHSQTRPFSVLEVIGAELTPEARAALQESGFESVKATPRGFRATKPRSERREE